MRVTTLARTGRPRTNRTGTDRTGTDRAGTNRAGISRPWTSRRLLAGSVAGAALAATLLSVPTSDAARADGSGRPASTIALPSASQFPEGIAVGDDRLYISSAATGAIAAADPHATQARPFIPAGQDGMTSSIGLNVRGDRLYAAGGPSGSVFVFSTVTGRLVRRFDTGSGGFLNDLAFDRSGNVYITDSTRPVLWRIAAAEVRPGTPAPAEPWLDLTGTAITYQNGFNLNGIELSADGRYLLAVQSNTGILFRISVATRQVTPVDLGGQSLAGDGMVLRGHTLWAVTNPVVTKVALNDQFSRGTVVSRTGDPTYATPTTIEITEDRLFVVNSQFAQQGGTPTLPFTVSRVAIP